MNISVDTDINIDTTDSDIDTDTIWRWTRTQTPLRALSEYWGVGNLRNELKGESKLSSVNSGESTLPILLKGTVQRKLTRVVSYINREVFHSH
jgi:hypothetical protein